jgi:hypothetical protein
MTKTINWHTRATHLIIALAFMLGMALVPLVPGTGIVEAAEGDPTLVPSDIAYNVKGSTHNVTIDLGTWNLTDYDIDWWLESGVELNPDDITVIWPAGCDEVKVKEDADTCDNVTSIGIRSMKRGDIHIYANIAVNVTHNITLHTEKKWGELNHTILDLDAETTGTQGPTETVSVDSEEIGIIEEILKDTVYATFLSVSGNRTVGHAIVHWWLFEDNSTAEGYIDDLMDHLVDHEGAYDDGYWAAHGKYDTEVLGDLLSVADAEPFDVIDYYASTYHAATDTFTWNDPVPDPDDWYVQTETEDSLPGEERGTTNATLSVNATSLTPCTPETVMIVILVSYPGGDDATDDPFNGENIVCIEKGKKTFHKGREPELTEVKTPQLRWAGEKIVLEKDWSDIITGQPNEYYVEYNLEFESVGTLHPVGDHTAYSEGLVVTLLDDYGVSRCILESEQAGEADVDAALYYTVEDGDDELVSEMGFLVYFLEFEDVTLAEDITPESGLTDLDTDTDDADVAVRVKGFFDYQHSHLMATTREATAIDLNGDSVADKWLPAGRYVLPDDWWLIAETTNINLRPNFDLMDQPDDDITSTSELGPYDTDVRTATDPPEAEEPCIGPFNTLQPWSTVDKWITEATVPADFTVAAPYTPPPRTAADLRNTVVPDGIIDEWDAPMPQALVIFEITDVTGPSDADLSGLDKGSLAGYGFIGTPKVYQSPFYAVEIPSSEYIPALGYNWNSWGADGPYEYWEDLGLASIIANTSESPEDDDDVEVYSDNHGIAAVTIDALTSTGTVTITATAEFPYTPKRGKYGPRVSEEIEVYWGIDVEHLDPDFEASPRSGEASLIVDFENWTTGGTHDYVEAKWDFNGDGVAETTLNGTEAQVLADVQWTYLFPGYYTVALTMTDSTSAPLGPLVHTETKVGYITVEGSHPYDTNHNGEIDYDEVVKAVLDYFAGSMTKYELIEIILLYFG